MCHVQLLHSIDHILHQVRGGNRIIPSHRLCFWPLPGKLNKLETEERILQNNINAWPHSISPRGMAGLYNGIDFKDLWKNTIRLMIKCEPGQLRQDSSMYNGVYTSHHVYSLHSSYSGPRKYCLGTSKGTTDWRLDHTGSAIITQDYPGDPCGHLSLRPRGHWSLASHCHWAPWSHWGTWGLSLVSPWIFMFYPLAGWCWHRGWCPGTGLVFTPHSKAQCEGQPPVRCRAHIARCHLIKRLSDIEPLNNHHQS